MISYIQDRKEKLKESLLIISIFSFIVLFDVNFRWLILIFAPYVFVAIVNNIKYKNYNFFWIGLILLTFLFSHLIINNLLNEFELTGHHVLSILLCLYIFYLSYFFYSEILKLKRILINSFFILFLFSSILGIFNSKIDAPFFCGGIKNFLYSIDDLFLKSSNFFLGRFEYEFQRVQRIDTILAQEIFSNINLSFGEYLFKENSHLGMIAPAFILTFLYRVTNFKINLLELILFFIFLILCFVKSSTTLLVGLFFSSLVIILFQYNKLNNKFIFSIIILLLFIISIFFSDKECKKRIIYDDSFSLQIEDEVNNFIIDEKSKNMTNITNSKFFNNLLNKYGTNISSQVFFYNLNLTFFSIYEKPLGWGFQNYHNAHKLLSNKYLVKKIKNYDHNLLQINNKDGSNNFNKILVEFGVIGILLYLFIFFYLINSRINIQEKIFLLSIVITQSVRGAGYFNGGFILIIFLIFMSYINARKKI